MRWLAALTLLWIGLAHAGPTSLSPNYNVEADVTETCTACHGLCYLDLAQGYDTPAEWSLLIASMVKLPQERDRTISQYLAANYPHKPEKAPVLVQGDTEITIEEWITPTLGQHTRDPVESPGGAIWWTGMWASLLGRLDPNTGVMQEYQLPSSARPHSIVPDAEGFIWYTGNSNGTIGRLNPADGSIKEYPTRAHDPYIGVFHPNGNLYFTSQHSNMLGSLNPKTGELREIETRKKPYGIKVGKAGDLFIAYNGANAIGRMHPDTVSVRYYDIPDAATRIRRLDVDKDQNVRFVNSTLGKIGKLDVDTVEVTQWKSPSGRTSRPYSRTVINNIVWFNESGTRPDALVRFDPATEQFQSWAVSSGIGIIRHTWET